ncbi:MAG: IPT/TIG domain-containing protein [Deltaproteobacteria bacterium]|nr:IPT/TIG domain-containing protein [Deltaproteobacteria bacterium]
MKRALLVMLAACAEPPASGPTLVRAMPDHGPLVGGTVIELAGSGFGPSTRVLVGGREAPLAHATSTTSLDVVLPPGDEPGDAELIVLTEDGSAIESDLFHYSAPPTIEALSPTDVIWSSGDSVITLTGTGFLDEGAGEPSIVVDGVLVDDAVVTSDTSLMFTVPSGPAFVRPTVELVNLRGTARKQRAFRYSPGPRPGLLLFSRFGESFATFYDPVAATSFAIPRLPTANVAFTTVFADDRGDLWGIDRSRRLGRIDFRRQEMIDPVQIQSLFPAIVRSGTRHIAIERIQRRIGTFDPLTNLFTPLGTPMIPCCGSFGIATDGTTVWFTSRTAGIINLNTVNLTTGAFGTPVPVALTAGIHFEELRFFNGLLYAPATDETLRSIDPATGAVTTLPVAPGRSNAMELVE